MVILLASIFFSGLFLPLYRLWWPAQIVSWSMPATYGMTMLQDIMLRGLQPNLYLYAALVAIGIGLFLAAWFGLRKLMGAK
jgi:ABC-2 type transport system permease protein